ncbi:glycosyltransferase [Desulfovibrio sp. OttesenSCG-928-I05]|nr:glycosyltransferase [Desulfovibrio sp. OttesenSCG-928-I05]
MKFSIIMATVNAEKHLPRALRSICDQTCADYEVIIQDGGSTDASARIAADFGERVFWESVNDSGIYDAWNKALKRIQGDWVLFLGADDMLLHKDVLQQAADMLEELPEQIIFAYGDLIIGTDGYPEQFIHRSLRAVYTIMLNTMGLPFPATFVRASLFTKQQFDTQFRIAGDYDLAARCMTADNIARLPLAITYMEDGGVSRSSAFESIMREEREQVLHTSILPRAEEFVGACIKYMDDAPCCGSKKKIAPGPLRAIGKKLRLRHKARVNGGRRSITGF